MYGLYTTVYRSIQANCAVARRSRNSNLSRSPTGSSRTLTTLITGRTMRLVVRQNEVRAGKKIAPNLADLLDRLREPTGPRGAAANCSRRWRRRNPAHLQEIDRMTRPNLQHCQISASRRSTLSVAPAHIGRGFFPGTIHDLREPGIPEAIALLAENECRTGTLPTLFVGTRARNWGSAAPPQPLAPYQ
jgi:hypothetical protein